jgi:glycosyltransferase involved in cell wall biosynthesis
LPPGGAETQVLALAKLLVRHGLSVAIIVYGRADDLPKIVDGVSIVTRPPYRKRSRLIGKFVETFQIWRALWRAPSRTVVKRGAGIDLGLIAVYARMAGRLLVFSSASVVDFDYGKLMPHRRDLLIYSLGVRLANTIVVQTEEQIELCKAKFGRHPTLIKSISATAEPQRGMPEAFIWVGRLVSYKRPLEYMALARALPEACFWMVGIPTPSDEHDKRLVDAVIAEAEELSNVELLPPRSHSELEGLMSRAVASVNTADFEGMPNVLLEAWSRGVPALTLNHDPDGVIGRYGLGGFAGGSHQALVTLAREQWHTCNDRRHLSERCHSYIAVHHAPDMIAVRWLEILSDPAVSGDIPSPGEGVELTCAE